MISFNKAQKLRRKHNLTVTELLELEKYKLEMCTPYFRLVGEIVDKSLPAQEMIPAFRSNCVNSLIEICTKLSIIIQDYRIVALKNGKIDYYDFTDPTNLKRAEMVSFFDEINLNCLKMLEIYAKSIN